MRSIDVVTIGRSSIDLYSQNIGADFINISGFSAFVGGGPLNVAVGAKRLGLNPYLITGVGIDLVGDFILNYLQKEGVDIKGVKKVAQGRTSAVLLGIQPPSSFPLMYYRDNAADWYIDQEDIERVDFSNVKVLLINGTALAKEPSRSATMLACIKAKEQNTKVYLDLDFRMDQWEHPLDYSNAIKEILSYVDVSVGTMQEIKAAIWSKEQKIEISKNNISAPNISGNIDHSVEQMNLLVDVIIMKKGPLGAVLITKNEEMHVAGYKAKVVNTLGAGDAFMTGLLYGYCKSLSIIESIRLGNACGALMVTKPGCSNFAPYLSELNDFIKNNS